MLDLPAILKQAEATAILIDNETLCIVARYSPTAAHSIERLLADIPQLVTALEEAHKALKTLRMLAVAAEAGNAVLGDARAAGRTLPRHIRETVDAILGESE